MTPLVLSLTPILVGESSVCGHVDEQDNLAHVVTEVHSATTVQNLCLVLVNGAICGLTRLWVHTQVTSGYVCFTVSYQQQTQSSGFLQCSICAYKDAFWTCVFQYGLVQLDMTRPLFAF